MSWESKSGPVFREAAQGDPRPILQTEQGRQEADAITRKAAEIRERHELIRDQNRNAWVANKAMQIARARDQPGGMKDGPVHPAGSTTRNPFQEAEQKFVLYRDKVSARVERVETQMLKREPGQNRIRGFEAVTRVQTPAERAQDSAPKREEPEQTAQSAEKAGWWSKPHPTQEPKRGVEDRSWWASRVPEAEQARGSGRVERHQMRDIGPERDR